MLEVVNDGEISPDINDAQLKYLIKKTDRRLMSGKVGNLLV